MFIVQIAGNLGKDPETRFTPSGQKLTTFNVASNARKGKEEVTIWVVVTVWGDRFDKMIAYLKKGSAIIVIGRMNPPRTYVDHEGKTQTSLDVTAEMLEFSPFGRSAQEVAGTAGQQPAGHNAHGQPAPAGAGGPDYGAHEAGSSYAGSTSGYNPGSYGSTPARGQSTQNHVTEDDLMPF